MTYLAVPIAASDFDKAADLIKTAVDAGAEMVELRTDYLQDLSITLVERLIEHVKTTAGSEFPIIVTCRDKQQGGNADYPEQLRVDVLCAALKAGARFVDFEYDNFLKPQVKGRLMQALSHSLKGRLILSAHNFEGKFDDIKKLNRQIETAFPAAIPKLVYTANNINDCFEAFDLLRQTSGERIVLCMGHGGLISRIIAKKLGSFVTFASLDSQTATAPGQLTIGQLKGLYRHDSIDTDTELYGVMACPVGHSLSPAVHNACFADIKANKLYLPLLIEGGKKQFDLFLSNAIRRSWLDFRGFSVTLPHKENALDFVKQTGGSIDPVTNRIGVANTLLINMQEHGDISACNTDYTGALDAITSNLGITTADFKNMDIAIVGAGGVARAVVAGLCNLGARIKIYNRTVEKAENLAAEFGCSYGSLEDLPSVDAQLLINCTSLGMHPNPDATPVPKQALNKDMAVFDTVYNPIETLLLKQAREIGARTIDGISLFVNQGSAQFKFFTGKDANTQLMRKTICDCMSV